MTAYKSSRSGRALRLGFVTAVVVASVPLAARPALAVGQWQLTGSMVTQQGSTTVAGLHDGRVLAISGQDGAGGLTPITELYNPATGVWTQTGSVNDPRMAFSNPVVLNDGRVLIAGGHDQFVNDYASAELYDPATGQWTRTGSLNTSRRYAVTVGLQDGRVLVATGSHGPPDGNRFLSSAEIYNPATGQWTFTGSAATRRESATGILMQDGRVMIVGGYTCCDFFTPATDLYNPATGTWSQAGNRPHGGVGMALVDLPNGRVLMVGGNNTTTGDSSTTDAVLFDPATGAWTATTPMHYARSGADAILLANGKVLVAGGGPLPGEIYDPATSTWSVDASLNVSHSGTRMMALPTGKILLAGGFGDSGATTAAELFTPTLDQTPPVVTGTPDRAANAHGWYRGPVTVTWTSTDPDPSSGAPTIPPPTTLSSDGGNQTATSGPSCDPAGNCATGSFGPVSIDSTPPTITYTAVPAPNVNGWNRANVTVTFTCSDALSGIASCSGPVTVNTNGADQQVTGTATDNAGNTATVTAHINLDKVAPTISGSASGTPNAFGWRKFASTVSFSCADNLSGVHICGPNVTLGEGANQSVTGTSFDFAGNSASTTVSGINIDLTPPMISFVVTPAKNANGWRHSASTVTFTCTDALSGIDTCTSPITLTGDGADQTVTGMAVDKAGRMNMVVVHVNIDSVSPTISGSVSGTPSAAGWYNTPPTVTFTCDDGTSGIDTCTPPATLGEGANQSVTGTAVDLAGNTASATVSGINVDTTPPTIGYTVAPDANTAGWNNTAVTVTFTCADTLSGVASCPDPVTVTGDGANEAVTGVVVDNAGNIASATAIVNLDTTAPVITANINTTPNGAGWYNTTPTVHFTCTDATSGIADCPPEFTFTGDGADQSTTGTATDVAGNTASTTVDHVNVDTTSPTVTVTGAVDGGTYLAERLPTPGCATTDATSGVATPATLSTSNDGTGHYTATCTGGTDTAGNTTPAVTIGYTAIAAVRSVVTNSRNVSTNNSITATVGAGGVAAGDSLAVAVATGTFAGAVTCTDTQNNTYTVTVDRNTGNGRMFVCTAQLTHALSAGDTITATYPGFSGLSLISVDAISALATNGSIDTATSNSGNSNSPAAGPVTTTQAGELLLGVIAHGSTPTLTPGTGWTPVGAFSAGTGSGRRTLTPEYQLAGNAGPYTATATLSAGQFWQAALIAYQTP